MCGPPCNGKLYRRRGHLLPCSTVLPLPAGLPAVKAHLVTLTHGTVSLSWCLVRGVREFPLARYPVAVVIVHARGQASRLNQAP